MSCFERVWKLPASASSVPLVFDIVESGKVVKRGKFDGEGEGNGVVQ